MQALVAGQRVLVCSADEDMALEPHHGWSWWLRRSTLMR